MSPASARRTPGDEAAVRSGEQLNVPAVDAWLKAQVPTLQGVPTVTQYTGGASNWTYRLVYDHDDLVLRRPPAGTRARSAHDMGREYDVQRALRGVFPYVPEMVARCTDTAVTGAEFYVMRRIPGVILRGRMPAGVALRPDQHRALCHAVVDRLVALHQVNVTTAGLSHLNRGPGYARRQIEGWTDRYNRARTWNAPKFTYVTRWLLDNAPADTAACVIHNDYRLDNVVLDTADPTRVVGVLDWEMATVGDPWMDLGNSLAYWVQADDDPVARLLRRQPTHLPGMLTRREVLAYYRSRAGAGPDDTTFYEVYGIFRLAAILQQIYYRYHHGQTRNPAFRHFWLVAHYLERRSRRRIGQNVR